MSYQGVITIEPGKRGGRPTIRGMRIAVADMLGWLAAGMTHEEILSDNSRFNSGKVSTGWSC